jgi:hypothetical protein
LERFNPVPTEGAKTGPKPLSPRGGRNGERWEPVGARFAGIYRILCNAMIAQRASAWQAGIFLWHTSCMERYVEHSLS